MVNNRIINESQITDLLVRKREPSKSTVRTILQYAGRKKGLSLDQVACLVNLQTPELVQELYQIARQIKTEIYGERLVFFAPLYLSDYCTNDCAYCNFHTHNKKSKRTKLSLPKIREQTRFLLNQGHKRILLECGEDAVHNPIDYVVEAIETIYTVKSDKSNIRRINVNVAATTVENYRELKQAQIGTYQLFQETYHYPTFTKVHRGPKSDYTRQITAHLRAFTAGIDDLGIGVLFGLYDWRFEVLSLVSHAQFMERELGVGPHTISVPRFRPAPSVTYQPEFPVSDDEFLKLIAILRLAVPYTGMILSTRETPELRKLAFQHGISQASAGSVTIPGGYGKKTGPNPQFSLADHRSLTAVVEDILTYKLLPSFCTACYRSGRTGEKFMNLSKPGEIHRFCRPNGLLSFAEYLEDYSRDNLYEKGYNLINYYLNQIESTKLRTRVVEGIEQIKLGKRDLYI